MRTEYISAQTQGRGGSSGRWINFSNIRPRCLATGCRRQWRMRRWYCAAQLFESSHVCCRGFGATFFPVAFQSALHRVSIEAAALQHSTQPRPSGFDGKLGTIGGRVRPGLDRSIGGAIKTSNSPTYWLIGGPPEPAREPRVVSRDWLATAPGGVGSCWREAHAAHCPASGLAIGGP
jgi:hypothetical protein